MNRNFLLKIHGRGFYPGTSVRHFKHRGGKEGLYRIERFVEHTETGEIFVIYHRLSD